MQPILQIINERLGGPERESEQQWVTQQAIAERVPNLPGITNYLKGPGSEDQESQLSQPFWAAGSWRLLLRGHAQSQGIVPSSETYSVVRTKLHVSARHTQKLFPLFGPSRTPVFRRHKVPKERRSTTITPSQAGRPLGPLDPDLLPCSGHLTTSISLQLSSSQKPPPLPTPASAFFSALLIQETIVPHLLHSKSPIIHRRGFSHTHPNYYQPIRREMCSPPTNHGRPEIRGAQK